MLNVFAHSFNVFRWKESSTYTGGLPSIRLYRLLGSILNLRSWEQAADNRESNMTATDYTLFTFSQSNIFLLDCICSDCNTET